VWQPLVLPEPSCKLLQSKEPLCANVPLGSPRLDSLAASGGHASPSDGLAFHSLSSAACKDTWPFGVRMATWHVLQHAGRSWLWPRTTCRCLPASLPSSRLEAGRLAKLVVSSWRVSQYRSTFAVPCTESSTMLARYGAAMMQQKLAGVVATMLSLMPAAAVAAMPF
jgi:hypothetical protein